VCAGNLGRHSGYCSECRRWVRSFFRHNRRAHSIGTMTSQSGTLTSTCASTSTSAGSNRRHASSNSAKEQRIYCWVCHEWVAAPELLMHNRLIHELDKTTSTSAGSKSNDCVSTSSEVQPVFSQPMSSQCQDKQPVSSKCQDSDKIASTRASSNSDKTTSTSARFKSNDCVSMSSDVQPVFSQPMSSQCQDSVKNASTHALSNSAKEQRIYCWVCREWVAAPEILMHNRLFHVVGKTTSTSAGSKSNDCISTSSEVQPVFSQPMSSQCQDKQPMSSQCQDSVKNASTHASSNSAKEERIYCWICREWVSAPELLVHNRLVHEVDKMTSTSSDGVSMSSDVQPVVPQPMSSQCQDKQPMSSKCQDSVKSASTHASSNSAKEQRIYCWVCREWVSAPELLMHYRLVHEVPTP